MVTNIRIMIEQLANDKHGSRGFHKSLFSRQILCLSACIIAESFVRWHLLRKLAVSCKYNFNHIVRCCITVKFGAIPLVAVVSTSPYFSNVYTVHSSTLFQQNISFFAIIALFCLFYIKLGTL